jgi:hypothetical protein
MAFDSEFPIERIQRGAGGWPSNDADLLTLS